MSRARERLLESYNVELSFIREMGGEFASEFSKIARRLDLREFECRDPYVERLLEGFAFLAARVRLKVEEEFPNFTQYLMQIVYPHLLAPTPSMAVVELQPNLDEGSLEEGYVVPRGTVLSSVMRRGEQTACQFTSASDVALWPISIADAEYLPTTAALSSLGVPGVRGAKAGVRLTLKASLDLNFADLAIDRLRLFIKGAEGLPMQIYERLVAHGMRVIVRPARSRSIGHVIDGRRAIRPVGFADEEALLPYGPRSFQGYRLLHEYFALPQRYMFVDLAEIGPGLRNCQGSEVDIFVLFDEPNRELEGNIDKTRFALFGTPVINLFEMRLDRVFLNNRDPELHIVPNRVKPLDYEIFDIQEVHGIGTSAKTEVAFQPFYAVHDRTDLRAERAYYALRREPRLVTRKRRNANDRLTEYVGSEVYISLVDANEAPYRHDLRQLGIRALCTNRDLPTRLVLGGKKTDFTLQTGAPVEAIRCLAGPTPPRESIAIEGVAWQLISHLSLNYLSLGGDDAHANASALSEMLSLYARASGARMNRSEMGLTALSARPVVERVPIPGPIAFGRGLEVKLTFDEARFEGTGLFLLGAVLEQFFAGYVSINSFTRTVIRSNGRGEVMRWPMRIGRRETL